MGRMRQTGLCVGKIKAFYIPCESLQSTKPTHSRSSRQRAGRRSPTAYQAAVAKGGQALQAGPQAGPGDLEECVLLG